jgi:putative GTP pyrophosphokinase
MRSGLAAPSAPEWAEVGDYEAELMPLDNIPTRSQIRKAGDIIRGHWSGKDVRGDDEVDWAMVVLDAYRAVHGSPLNAATMALRSMARTVGANASISQRLKRHASIINKLVVQPRMDLTRMQDIGGCRAVVATLKEVEAIRNRWRRWSHRERPGNTLKREYDYIAEPKSSGYRGVHVIVTYHERLVEVQLRTAVQHEWATTIERVGGRIEQDLKGGRGPREVLEFFEYASRAMRIEEAGAVVPRNLVDAVKAARRRAEPFLRPR